MENCGCRNPQNPPSTPEMAPTVPPKRILCVGMCVLDIIHVLEQFPVEDCDKRCLAGYWQRGGNASNNCTVFRQLGVEQVEFLGMLTDARAFAFLMEDCRQRGILIEHCPSDASDPPFSTVLLNKATGSRTIIHSNADFPILTYAHFRQLQLSDYCWMHFEGRNPEETLRMLRDIATYNNAHSAAEQITVSVDLEKSKPELLVLAELAHYVFLGKDLAQHLGWTNVEQAMQGLMSKLTPQPEVGLQKPAIICTWGATGSGCLDAQGRSAIMPPVPVANVEDSLGAGDTFCAATIYALAKCDANLPTAVKFGNSVAGYKLGHRGYDAIGQYKEKPVHCDWPTPKSTPTPTTKTGVCECENEDV